MPSAQGYSLPAFHPFVNADIPWLICRAAQEYADRQLMIWEPFDAAPRTWTYREAYSDIRRIAATLLSMDVKPGDAVILHMENAPEAVLAWFACACIGAVAVSTNARCAGEELAYFAEKSRAVGIISQSKFAEMIAENLPHIGWVKITAPADDSLLGDYEAEPGHFGPEHPFAVQFTSGTTSRPKGVVWTHANGLWGAMVNARHFQLTRDDVSSITNPLFHTVALAWQVLGSIWVGGSFVIHPKFSASRFWDIVVRNRCTWGQFGFFMAQALAAHPRPEKHYFRMNAGGVSFANPDNLLNIRSVGAHGMTELISHAVMNDPLSVMDEGSMGRPAPEYTVRLVKDDGEQAGFGEVGELQVKGVPGLSLFAGYLNDDDATADAFTNDGYFKTGDLVRLREDGAFVFADRKKDMLKVGGENVAASEIEAVIRQVTGVKDVAIVAGPDKMRGEVPVAFVIALPDAGENLAEQIAESCKQRLADFKQPRLIRFIEEFPRILDSKVSKAKLREMLMEEAK